MKTFTFSASNGKIKISIRKEFKIIPTKVSISMHLPLTTMASSRTVSLFIVSIVFQNIAQSNIYFRLSVFMYSIFRLFPSYLCWFRYPFIFIYRRQPRIYEHALIFTCYTTISEASRYNFKFY